MTKPKAVIRLVVLLSFCPLLRGQDSASLPRSAPEAQGVSSKALGMFVGALDSEIEGMHSIMVVRHGHVVAEGWWAPYSAEKNHVLYSLSKSFTSTAVGLAIAEGKLSIDHQVGGFFPDAMPTEPSNNLKSMRVRDLLTMATGHQDEPSAAPDVVSPESFLAQEVTHLPGTYFKYNTAATFMQSAIVQKVTGQTVLDYLQPRLFEPLGIEKPVWDTNFQGISLGGYGLRVRTEDIAKFGQLYLQNGKWNGQQLIPAIWVEQATSKQVSNGSNPTSDWNQGYGFQFWQCRHDAYRGDGAFGQYCIVMPKLDAVIAITSGVSSMQAVLDVVWSRFIPACHPDTLRPNDPAHEQLKNILETLRIPTIEGNRTSPLASTVFDKTYILKEEYSGKGSLRITSAQDSDLLTITLDEPENSLTFKAGYTCWKTGRSPFPVGRLSDFKDEPVASSYAWTDESTLVLKVCAVETPFHLSFRLIFDGDRVTIDSESNVAFGPKVRPTLTGKISSSR